MTKMLANPLSVQVDEGVDMKRNDSLSAIPYQGQPTPLTSNGSIGSNISSDGEKSGPHFEIGTQEYIPLHERITKRINDRTPFFSLEFFPPKTANGVANFFTRLDRKSAVCRYHLAHGLGSSEHRERNLVNFDCDWLPELLQTMLHMTCVQYTKSQSLEHLEQCKQHGLRNILALRGDLPTQLHQFRALDMIRWIREEFDDYFTVACSGYPLGHPEAPSYKADLLYLKAKVDAGAHFVITQLFFEAESFERFVRDCREIGITCPIIPGIMPIMGYDSIRRIAALSQLTIPDYILADLEPIKHDDDAAMAVKMCHRLLSNGSAPSIHLYTMNREGACREILQQLGLWQKRPMRALPWEPHGGNHPIRCKEDVRPIFWSGRPKSYIYRTRDWDDFPNGRWGNSSSPAFNDIKDYYLFHLHGAQNKEEQLKKYGYEISTIDDVRSVFVNFLLQKANENGIIVKSLPWSEQDSGLSPETKLIQDQLLWCLEHNIFTINSQPSVNGAPSNDPLVGWGKPGGYCYQKAYLECFIPAEYSSVLLEIISEYEPRINYHLINHDSSVDATNAEKTTPIAVTWGVFPGCEIAQPTVVDPISYRVWKDEAYEMWTDQWARLYPEASRSRAVLTGIHDNFHLLNMVDNDFQKPCIIFEILNRVLCIIEQRSGRRTAAASY